MRYKGRSVDSEVIAPGSAEQGFKERHYFWSMRLHKEAFAAIVQTKVELLSENFENIDPVLLSKLIELRKSPSPALVEEIMKLDSFKDINQHIVSATYTESQMTVKYLKDMSTMLAIVSAVREVV